MNIEPMTDHLVVRPVRNTEPLKNRGVWTGIGEVLAAPPLSAYQPGDRILYPHFDAQRLDAWVEEEGLVTVRKGDVQARLS